MKKYSKQNANYGTNTMETETIQKNGASPKSQMSREEALQNYINQLAEEIVLKREDFATNRKWLKKYIEMENISFEAYEKELLQLLINRIDTK
jgi:hypothetical protein